jgi:alkanesulfonate monooxygenase SsuD/methylene tetrahydromethanopterin reductase-like flavin-dependent oxidoreductase (luciferase family)
MDDGRRPSFGLKTVPVRATYAEIAQVWREADGIPVIEHAWLWDHLIPLFGDAGDPILEGWTTLAALAAGTTRLGLGLSVTSNVLRPPTLLGKMAATVDVISGGRLTLGIGVGATAMHVEGQELAEREFRAYGLPLLPPAEGRERLAEACGVFRRMWTEEVFDHDGPYLTLRGMRCEPKPVQRPGPPIMIGAWGDRSLRIVAEHADLWNVPGPPHRDVAFVAERGRVLEDHCAAIGRDPREITWSVQLVADAADPARTRGAVGDLLAAGVRHVIVGVAPPYRPGLARWAADEVISPVLEEFGVSA